MSTFEQPTAEDFSKTYRRAVRAEALVGVLRTALQEAGECLEDAMHSDYGATGWTTFEHWKAVRDRAFTLAAAKEQDE